MHHNDVPSIDELPSSQQLFKSTAIALAVAITLLVAFVLPAEYGIDPVGVGRVLVLKKMGEIKVSLKEEAAGQSQAAASPTPVRAEPVASAAVPVQSIPPPPPVQYASSLGAPAAEPPAVKAAAPVPNTPATPGQNHEMSFALKPGAGAEIKLRMLAKAKVSYQWEAKGGKLNCDAHGDPAKGASQVYAKGRQVERDQGELVAAFDGKHGWFWRNRTEKEVVVTLKTRGDYSEIKRVL